MVKQGIRFFKATNQPKMQLSVYNQTADSTVTLPVTDWLGTWGVSDAELMKFGYDNPYWFSIKNLKIFKEVTW